MGRNRQFRDNSITAAARPSLGRAGLSVVALPLRSGSSARPQRCAPPKSLWMRRVFSRTPANRCPGARRPALEHELHATCPARAWRPHHEVASRRSPAWRTHGTRRLQALHCWPPSSVLWAPRSRRGRRCCSWTVAWLARSCCGRSSTRRSAPVLGRWALGTSCPSSSAATPLSRVPAVSCLALTFCRSRSRGTASLGLRPHGLTWRGLAPAGPSRAVGLAPRQRRSTSVRCQALQVAQVSLMQPAGAG